MHKNIDENKTLGHLSFPGLLCTDLIFIEACLRCLRTVFISPVTPVQLLYTVGFHIHSPFVYLGWYTLCEKNFIYVTLLAFYFDGFMLPTIYARFTQLSSSNCLYDLYKETKDAFLSLLCINSPTKF